MSKGRKTYTVVLLLRPHCVQLTPLPLLKVEVPRLHHAPLQPSDDEMLSLDQYVETARCQLIFGLIANVRLGEREGHANRAVAASP
jgi:hypothetical protein